MELGHQNHNGDGLLGPNPTIVVYMDPLGMRSMARWLNAWAAGGGRIEAENHRLLAPGP